MNIKSINIILAIALINICSCTQFSYAKEAKRNIRKLKQFSAYKQLTTDKKKVLKNYFEYIYGIKEPSYNFHIDNSEVSLTIYPEKIDANAMNITVIIKNNILENIIVFPIKFVNEDDNIGQLSKGICLNQTYGFISEHPYEADESILNIRILEPREEIKIAEKVSINDHDDYVCISVDLGVIRLPYSQGVYVLGNSAKSIFVVSPKSLEIEETFVVDPVKEWNSH